MMEKKIREENFSRKNQRGITRACVLKSKKEKKIVTDALDERTKKNILICMNFFNSCQLCLSNTTHTKKSAANSVLHANETIGETEIYERTVTTGKRLQRIASVTIKSSPCLSLPNCVIDSISLIVFSNTSQYTLPLGQPQYLRYHLFLMHLVLCDAVYRE